MSTILFVDDHHALRTVFAETLRNAGHEVLEAGSLPDAEHLVARRRGAVDLLIVAAVLTTTNGIAVARQMQQIYPAVQVLFISDESVARLSEEALLPERASFLREPFDAKGLITKVQEMAAWRAAKPRSKSRENRKSTPLKTAHSHH